MVVGVVAVDELWSGDLLCGVVGGGQEWWDDGGGGVVGVNCGGIICNGGNIHGSFCGVIIVSGRFITWGFGDGFC